ncbi:phosphotransferase family protein [Nonomuraea maritima]|uniref:phosphotransferase family protein n=1 Tax=Nonomuraea maritima TaxID=683260 RepID=UPI0037177843
MREFDRPAARAGAPVLTHGEPHPGNVLRAGSRTLLVDWDTVGTAPPERDLWHVVRDAGDLARYAAATGRTPDPGMRRCFSAGPARAAAAPRRGRPAGPA